MLAACWLANPARPLPHPLVLPLAGAAAIWLIGVPFGLARLHWRFTSLRDLAFIGGASVLTALLLTLLLVGSGLKLPSFSFPACLALCLVAALATPRLLYRLKRQPGATAVTESDTAAKAILVGNRRGIGIVFKRAGPDDVQPLPRGWADGAVLPPYRAPHPGP